MKDKTWNKKVETEEKEMFNSLLKLRKQIIDESISDVRSTRHRQEVIGTHKRHRIHQR